jgi:hypothetical protein
MIVLAEHLPTEGNGNLGALSAEWKQITGDSHMVDIRPIDLDDPVSGFIEVFKYAVKFSDQSPADTVHAWETLAGKRLLGSAGCFRGVKVPESLLDAPEGFEGLEYIQLFYRYLPGGYSLAKRSEGVEPAAKTKRSPFVGPPKPKTEKQILLDVQHDRLMGHALGMRNLPGGYGVHPMEAKRN